MIQNINDLSLFLNTVKDFPAREGVAKKQLLRLVQEKYSYIQWDIQTKEMLNFGLSLNLFTMNGNNVVLTRDGEHVLSLSSQTVDLNKNQLAYIVKKCFFNNSNFSELIDFLTLFEFDARHGTLVYDINECPIPNLSIEILHQLHIISNSSPVWKINTNYIEFISKKARRAISQDQLIRILEEQRRLGEKGELLTIQYEKKRLESQKLFKEAKAVKQSSIENVSQGYDIESFKGDSKSLAHDFFIEVKARKDKIFSFIISSNEIQTAKRLGKNYAIYFWNDVGSNNSKQPERIIIDPVEALDIDTCENCLQYIVYLDGRGLES